MAYLHGNNTMEMYNGRVVDMSSESQYTAVNLDPEFDLDLSGSGHRKPSFSGPIHTFQRRRHNVYGKLQHAVKPILNIRNARRSAALVAINIFVLFLLISWCSSSNSVALRAFSFLSIFDLLTLLTYLLSIWISTRQKNLFDDGVFVFSQERIEILMVFGSVVMSGLGAIFILKESFLRLMEQPEIAIGRLLPGAFVGLLFHLLLTFSIRNKPLRCVSEASSSSVIQEHVSDLTQPLCSWVPFLNRILQPRVDPFFLLSALGATLVLLTDLLIQIDLYYSADTVAAILLAFCTVNTMWPIAVCSARVLLNTTPPYVLAQLDKLLSEAQTLDGVLEIRNERFHTIALSSSKDHTDLRSRNGFGLILVGSISVRVRRDADEQMVLAHVTNRLSPLVSQLTVQVVKDDWSAPSVPAPPGLSATIKSPGGSAIIYGFNKPAAAVAPYQQSPPKKAISQPQFDPQKPTFDVGKIPAVRKLSDDDFSFSRTPLNGPLKPGAYSTAGSNIARMYKAAGFTTPPASKRVSSAGNLTSLLPN